MITREIMSKKRSRRRCCRRLYLPQAPIGGGLVLVLGVGLAPL